MPNNNNSLAEYKAWRLNSKLFRCSILSSSDNTLEFYSNPYAY